MKDKRSGVVVPKDEVADIVGKRGGVAVVVFYQLREFRTDGSGEAVEVVGTDDGERHAGKVGAALLNDFLEEFGVGAVSDFVGADRKLRILVL